MKKEQTIRVVVSSIRKETSFVTRFRLSPLNGSLPSFIPGSHIVTYLQRDDEVIVRSYSLVSDPGDSQYEIAVRLSDSSKGGSAYWHNRIKAGDIIHISYPKNYLQLSDGARQHIFYAAGIGITPFLSMMLSLQNRNIPFELHYAAKSKEQCPFYSELLTQYSSYCHFYFSQEQDSRRLSPVDLERHTIGTHVYFCGPEKFIEEFSAAANDYGYPNRSIHVERFSAPTTAINHDFQVELQDGRIIDVPSHLTLLETLIACGMNVPYSCRIGKCGTCELAVTEGEVEHGDSFFSEEEKKSNKMLLSCVSRAKSTRLKLNL